MPAPKGNDYAKGNSGGPGAPPGNDYAAGNDGGAPEGNTNAVGNDGGAPLGNGNATKHNAYSGPRKLYIRMSGGMLWANKITDLILDCSTLTDDESTRRAIHEYLCDVKWHAQIGKNRLDLQTSTRPGPKGLIQLPVGVDEEGTVVYDIRDAEFYSWERVDTPECLRNIEWIQD